MAYAAVISLKHTIDSLLESSRISLVSSTQQILKSAYHHTTSLQQVLQRFNDSSSSSKRLEALDGQIRDVANKLEDVLELYESNQLYSDRESYEDEGAHHTLSLGLKEVSQEITSFVEKVKKMEAEYIEELLSPIQEDDGDGDDDDGDFVSSNVDFGVEMVGYHSELIRLRDNMLERMRPNDMCFFSYVGEAGTCRAVIAKTIFEDTKHCFDCGAWVTIGTRYQQFKDVAMCILDQVDNDNDGEDYKSLVSGEDEKICSYLYKTLEHRKYMIVLDDVRDVHLLHSLKSSFPDQINGSLVFLTTSLEEIAESVQSSDTSIARVSYVQESSWHFLKLAVFGINVSISQELEEAGKKINENCGGRPMVLAKTLLFLLKTEKTLERWRNIAADKENPIFRIEDEISEMSKIKTEMQSHKWNMYDQREDYAVKLISAWLSYSASVARIKKKMHPKRFFSKMQIISLWGMAGIGKSTYAKNIIQDSSILCHYDHCVWVTLGPKYEAEEILIDILAQIYPSRDKMHMKENERLVKELCAQLSCKRCLIVVDDLWSTEPLYHLKRLFPDIQGRALVTTRLAEVANFGEDDKCYDMRFLDKEESWSLLCKKVFGEGDCPPKLEKAGRKIAEKCDGLPLLLLKVGDQLLKVEKDPDYWNDVASGKEKSVFMNAHHQISQALRPSYQNLPQHLKPYFLYMGVFREKYKISTSKLTNMLISEGFLEPNLLGNVEHFVAECLSDLAWKSVIMVLHEPPNFRMKRVRLHSVFWHLCNSEAVKNKFFHAMTSYEDCFMESMKSQRRLSIRNSILLGMKDVQNSMASITSAHSLLCVSPPHQYPVPISFGLKLLRVMDALAIRLYEFPIEVVKLFHLRYLALTCNGNLPASISNLWKLQHLIVSRYMNTKSSKNSSLLPTEIWDMQELKHLQIMGGILPNPKRGAGLPKLSTLVDVSAQSCTEEVLEMIPNLKRLGIRIELAPDDEANPFHCLNHISHLSRLESLKCVVVNPQFSSKVVPPPPPTSMFPSSLKRLCLSGFGYPWEYMSMIGKLRNLEMLKLKSYAFRGPKWEINCLSDFEKLKFLLIEDTDLVHWELKLPICRQLECISIKHCYKLQVLPAYLPITGFKKIEIVDCNPTTVTWAEKMRQQLKPFPVEAHLSWI